MGKYGNFGGMPGGMNMKDMMKQAQKMQEQMKAQAAELEKKEFTAAAGGGAVNVKVSGKKELLEQQISRNISLLNIFYAGDQQNDPRNANKRHKLHVFVIRGDQRRRYEQQSVYGGTHDDIEIKYR